MRTLLYLTNFGDPYLTVPLAGLVLAWLATMRSWRSLSAWAICFTAGALIVAASRVAHFGWGIQVAALNFTVISGHTMLASAVYPTALAICASRTQTRTIAGMFVAGLTFAFAIGASRVLIGFHSTAEVVSGFLIGALAAALTCVLMIESPAQRASGTRIAFRDPAPFTMIALAVIIMCHGKVAPVSAWIDRAAPELSQWSKTQFEEAR